MIDLEISKALALAIGWKYVSITRAEDRLIVVYTGTPHDRVKSCDGWFNGYRIFDYRDWNVIGPIAQRYDLFPRQYKQHGSRYDGYWVTSHTYVFADTPQKAIALAVIGAKK